MRNLFTIAIKIGTDALESDTGTQLFLKIMETCQRTENHFTNRVRTVPHSKDIARLMHDNRFNPEETKAMNAWVCASSSISWLCLGSRPPARTPAQRIA